MSAKMNPVPYDRFHRIDELVERFRNSNHIRPWKRPCSWSKARRRKRSVSWNRSSKHWVPAAVHPGAHYALSAACGHAVPSCRIVVQQFAHHCHDLFSFRTAGTVLNGHGDYLLIKRLSSQVARAVGRITALAAHCVPASGELQCSTRAASPTVVIMVVMCCSVRTASRTTMGACPVPAIMASSSSAAATPAWPSMLVRPSRITSPL
jgi:hypothetical protein